MNNQEINSVFEEKNANFSTLTKCSTHSLAEPVRPFLAAWQNWARLLPALGLIRTELPE